MTSRAAIMLLPFLVACTATQEAHHPMTPEQLCVIADTTALKKFENHEPPLHADFVARFRKNGNQIDIRKVRSSGLAEFDSVAFDILKSTTCPGIAKLRGADKVGNNTIFPIPFTFSSGAGAPRRSEATQLPDSASVPR